METKKSGIIIYAPEDVGKNNKFIRICKNIFNDNNIKLRLVVLQDKDQPDFAESINFKEEKPDFAINRSRNATIARQLEECGVRVFNSSKVTEICNDKWETYLFAQKTGIPVIETYPGDRNKKTVDKKIGYPKVLKSCSGHGGREVFMVGNEQEEKTVMQELPPEYIVQKFANTKGRDVRVYVIGGQIIAAMCRTAGSGFKSNFSLGGTAEPYQLNSVEREMIGTVVENLAPDYVGIDFFYDGDRLVLNEIEDAVGARMVYVNTSLDIIKNYAEYIMRQDWRV